MCFETVAIAGAVLTAIGIGLGWYSHHQNRADKKKENKKQESEYSIGQNVAGLH